jgi:hypothetical protein
VELKGGGLIHLSMNFVLTDEERKKIETMVSRPSCIFFGNFWARVFAQAHRLELISSRLQLRIEFLLRYILLTENCCL